MSLSIKKVKDHKKWGWEAWVLKNDWITLAAMPDIGGRIMDYSLGTHSPVYVNPALKGQVIKPEKDQDWPNFGGYKIWPAPQNQWNWPPPPNLDHGKYSAEIEHESTESVTLLLKSPVEEYLTPGIRLERRISVKHNSTKVQMKETLINESDQDVSWSIWDVTQNVVQHLGQEDFENFWIYFPLNPKSRYGSSGVYASGESEGWQGEIAPGIYGVRFNPDAQKLFSDPREGWIAYEDQGLQIISSKTFPLYHGKSYPDNEARIAVYLNTHELPYLEVEVMGPVISLSPGEKTSFSIDWGIARGQGPVLDVNDIGIISKRLTVSDGRLQGTYGVFYEGSLSLVFRDLRGVMLKKTLPQSVSPIKPVQVNQPVKIEQDVRLVEVQINGPDGHVIGILDTLEISPDK